MSAGDVLPDDTFLVLSTGNIARAECKENGDRVAFGLHYAITPSAAERQEASTMLMEYLKREELAAPDSTVTNMHGVYHSAQHQRADMERYLKGETLIGPAGN